MEMEGGRNASTVYLVRKVVQVRIRSCQIGPTCHGILTHSARLLIARGLAQIALRSSLGITGARGFRFSRFKARGLSRAQQRAKVELVYIPETMAQSASEDKFCRLFLALLTFKEDINYDNSISVGIQQP